MSTPAIDICCVVWPGGMACGRPSKAAYEGQHYCGIHNPARIINRAARRKKAAAPVQGWQQIETAPKDRPIWAFNGEQGVMEWTEGDRWALWVWSDDILSDSDPSPDQPTHWMPLPLPPVGENE